MFEDFRLKVFMTLDAKGSFTAAAKELGISQPAVSQNIAELERNLGEPLFLRTRGEVVLTEKGKLFKEYAKQILHWYEATREAFLSPQEASAPQKVELEIGEGRRAELWGSQGDLHIKIL